MVWSIRTSTNTTHDIFTGRNVCRQYSYDGKAGRMPFNITFDVQVTQLEVCLIS